jgi:hypothetical protein
MGKNLHRALIADGEEWRAWESAAAEAGMTWQQWVKHILNSKTQSAEFLTHQYLKIARYHRNEKSAEALLFDILKPIYPERTEQDLRATMITFDYGKGPFTRSFSELLRDARETGTPGTLRHDVAEDEPFFVRGMSIAAGEGLDVESSFAGQSVKLSAPLRAAPIEDELCDDILHFRREACESSSFHNFVQCLRSYRAYVFACASLVEAFFNRPVLLFAHQGRKHEAIEKLPTPLRMEDRIALWVDVFCVRPLTELKSTRSWQQFQELRQERNRLLHARATQFGTQIADLPYRLNWVRDGVGGLMKSLRAMQGLPPTGFIDRLESAPVVEFRRRKNPS